MAVQDFFYHKNLAVLETFSIFANDAEPRSPKDTPFQCYALSVNPVEKLHPASAENPLLTLKNTLTMDRGERREIKERKWVSKLKKMYQGGWKKFFLIKTSGKKGAVQSEAESYRDLENSRKGVRYKNTGTIEKTSKQYSAKDQHKRDLKNKSLSQEEQEELDEALTQQK